MVDFLELGGDHLDIMIEKKNDPDFQGGEVGIAQVVLDEMLVRNMNMIQKQFFKCRRVLYFVNMTTLFTTDFKTIRSSELLKLMERIIFLAVNATDPTQPCGLYESLLIYKNC